MATSYYGLTTEATGMRHAACAFAISMLCMCAGCARGLQSCLAHVMLIGPVTITMTCPPPGFVPILGRDE